MQNKNIIINNLPKTTKFKNIEFYVKVLTDSAWPVDKMLTNKNPQSNACNLPNVLDSYIQEFTNFYYERFKSRTLTWIHELSWAKMTAKFGTKSYSLIVSNYQMAILILFNSKSYLTYSELLVKLGCTDNDIIKRHLYALFYTNILKISKKNNNDQNINSEDIIFLNREFQSNQEKLVLNVKNKNLNLCFSKKDEISHFVLDDRKHQLDAVIMKALKQNKRMNFENLKNTIIKSVSNYFIPEVNLIKNRIDNLIEREYISRDMNNPEYFTYATY